MLVIAVSTPAGNAGRVAGNAGAAGCPFESTATLYRTPFRCSALDVARRGMRSK
jgi:hypothetical protein